ncbi:hypothetical protein B296_00001942 [Ensete ventricosum]|uniref:Uncharacterized protein n=1 Tax=Ensete ventricosum TaxID=4639 RepID=A0A426ZYY6_ENSVE|nr:hypothetical protein B296_00001942 [Ensete ventricosum]
MRSRPRAWLVPAWATSTGLSSTRRGGAHEGAPFRDGASPQGRRLGAKCSQELPPEGQRCPSAHWGSGAYRKGGRPWARRPLDEGRRGGLGSVEVTVGPTMPWREITMHGDVMRIR